MTLNLIAQIGVSNTAPNNNNPNYLINNVLVGGGVTISNIQFTGDNQQIGYFSNGNSMASRTNLISFSKPPKSEYSISVFSRISVLVTRGSKASSRMEIIAKVS